MNRVIAQTVVELKDERHRIDQALAALKPLGRKPPQSVRAAQEPHQRRMTAQGRAAIAKAQRLRWARIRKEKRVA